MRSLRYVFPLALAFSLAMRTVAEPPTGGAPAPLAPAQGEALDVSPAPEKAAARATPERVRPAPELPPAARSGAWRAGARPPGDVPANVVVRAAMRQSAGAKARPGGGPETENPRVIEIIWHAPGS
jgi:hypothetical protein